MAWTVPTSFPEMMPMESVPFSEVYFDNNATTQPLPEVRDAMVEVLGVSFGNPSSAHSTGDRARTQIVKARESVASLIGAKDSEIIFTSGGTEANNLAFNSFLYSLCKKQNPPKLITTVVEHSSIIKMGEYLEDLGVEVVFLPVDSNGQLCLDELKNVLTADTTLVSIQWVNNETGVIQPIEEIGQVCKELEVPFHVDAAQAVGKLPMNVATLPVDFLSLTAHKFHGPQGAGALYVRPEQKIHPVLFGGTQEDGIRPGTENVPGIVGMGKAAQLRMEKLSKIQKHLQELRDYFERQILERISDVAVNGDVKKRICNTSNLLFHEVDGQALIARLDMDGILCSQSSACTNQQPEPSYVLRKMGLSEKEAYSSIRFSFSELNTFEEIDYAVDTIAVHCNLLRKLHARKMEHFSGVN